MMRPSTSSHLSGWARDRIDTLGLDSVEQFDSRDEGLAKPKTTIFPSREQLPTKTVQIELQDQRPRLRSRRVLQAQVITPADQQTQPQVLRSGTQNDSVQKKAGMLKQEFESPQAETESGPTNKGKHDQAPTQAAVKTTEESARMTCNFGSNYLHAIDNSLRRGRDLKSRRTKSVTKKDRGVTQRIESPVVQRAYTKGDDEKLLKAETHVFPADELPGTGGTGRAELHLFQWRQRSSTSKLDRKSESRSKNRPGCPDVTFMKMRECDRSFPTVNLHPSRALAMNDVALDNWVYPSHHQQHHLQQDDQALDRTQASSSSVKRDVSALTADTAPCRLLMPLPHIADSKGSSHCGERSLSAGSVSQWLSDSDTQNSPLAVGSSSSQAPHPVPGQSKRQESVARLSRMSRQQQGQCAHAASQEAWATASRCASVRARPRSVIAAPWADVHWHKNPVSDDREKQESLLCGVTSDSPLYAHQTGEVRVRSAKGGRAWKRRDTVLSGLHAPQTGSQRETSPSLAHSPLVARWCTSRTPGESCGSKSSVWRELTQELATFKCGSRWFEEGVALAEQHRAHSFKTQPSLDLFPAGPPAADTSASSVHATRAVGQSKRRQHSEKQAIMLAGIKSQVAAQDRDMLQVAAQVAVQVAAQDRDMLQAIFQAGFHLSALQPATTLAVLRGRVGNHRGGRNSYLRG